MMERMIVSRFGWNWLDTSEWCDGLIDDQGEFIPEYRLYNNVCISVMLYLASGFIADFWENEFCNQGEDE